MKIALPNKGRLAEGARELLERAGLEFDMRDRALQAALGDDFTAIFVNARDVPEFVADGAADLGIRGGDIVAESGRDVQTLLDLGFGRCPAVATGRLPIRSSRGSPVAG
jgi:ATP phosphoribosyltransferase